MLRWMYRRMSLSNKQDHHVKETVQKKQTEGVDKFEYPAATAAAPAAEAAIYAVL